MIDFYSRRAIWEVHSRRCTYCGLSLSFSDLEVDHLIPQSLKADTTKWTAILVEQGLPQGFDVDAYENLTASCHPCNAKKRDLPLLAGRLGIELAKAQALAPQVRALCEKYRREESSTRLKLRISAAIEAGTVSAQELTALISSAQRDMQKFPIKPLFSLLGVRSVREVSYEDFERYLDIPASLPSDMTKGLRLVKENHEEIYVRTAREFREVTGQGYYPMTTFEMAMSYQHFEHPLFLLKILRRAAFASESFIDDPRIGLADIALLPGNLLFVTEDMTSDEAFAGQRERLATKTIEQLVTSGEARISHVGSDEIAIEHDHGRTFMLEIMRADMNGDGIQDILIHCGGGPIGGTYRSAGPVVLTKLSSDATFQTVNLDGLLQAR